MGFLRRTELTDANGGESPEGWAQGQLPQTLKACLDFRVPKLRTGVTEPS